MRVSVAIANALDGMSRNEAVPSAGMDRHPVRLGDPLQRAWVADLPHDGRPPKLDANKQGLSAPSGLSSLPAAYARLEVQRNGDGTSGR